MNAVEAGRAGGPAPPVPEATRRGSPPAPVWLAVAATLLGLVLGWGLKAPCTSHPWADNFQYRRLCYNDLQPLAGGRGILQGEVPYRDHDLEYPVLTGTFMYGAGVLLRRVAGMGAAASHSPWLLVGAALAAGAGAVSGALRSRAAKVASVAAFTAAGVLVAVYVGAVRNNTDTDYFRLSAILLAPFALAVTLALRPFVARERLMLWAIGSPLVLYAFHNWDLLAVAGAAWGLAELERSRYAVAGGALSLGASAKLYPGFLFPGAVLERLAAKDRAGARRLVWSFFGVGVAVNLPWFLLSPSRWIGIWTFHANRYPDFGTVWYWLAHHGRRLLPSPGWDPVGAPAVGWYQSAVSYLSLLLFAVGTLWFLWHGWRRAEREGVYPTAAVGLGIVAVFLLVSKVHSPQYALWIVPLVAMLDVPWRYVFAYLAGDFGVFVAGFSYFTVLSNPAPGWMGILEVAVLVRAAALWALVWYAARARRLQPAQARQEVPWRSPALDPAPAGAPGT
jgi:uncharacterized membrane protein